MKRITRLMGILLAFILLLEIFPVLVFAQEASLTELSEIASGTCGDNATWTVYSDKSLVISGTGAVTSAPWKDGYSTAYSLVIEEGITKLCSHAFREMPKLSCVQLPLSLTEIPSYCFSNCTSLASIDIPESITKIGEFAFGNTGFTSFTIPDSVTSDIHDIVSGSQLAELYIGAGAQISENNWNDFNEVPNLQKYVVSADNPYYASQDGVLYTKDMKTLVKYPDGRPGNLSIPSGVEVIARYAFYCADKITEINIPDSVTTIGNGNFSLYKAKMLQDINVDDNNEYFSSYNGVLYNKAKTKVLRCGLGKQGSIELHPNIWEIGASAFSNCAEVTAVSIPNSVEAIGSSAFHGCSSLEKIVVPESVTEWGQFCFMDCDSLQWIACGVKNCNFYQDFDGCYSLKDVYYYGSEAEWNTITISSFDTPVKNAIKHYNSPLPGTWVINYHVNDGTNAADNPSTYYNYNEDITLSDPVKEGCSFGGWYIDEELTQEATVPQVIFGHSSGEKDFFAKWSIEPDTHKHVFDSNNKCECGAIGGTCGENLIWTLNEEGTLIISGIGDVEEQPWSAYRSNIKSLIVEEGITGVGVSAFANCINLDNIVLPDSITYIDLSAFHSCVKLNSISIPASVSFIDPDAFAGCDNLSGIWVDKDNTKYANDSYGVLFNKDMTRLVKYPEGLSGAYIIPDGVITIGSDAFMSSQNLTGVTFSDTVVEISNSGFVGCNSLKNIVIPSTITKIDSMAFAYCGSLERITFEGNAPSLNDIVFAETTTTAYYPANNSTWTEEVMQDYGGDITWKPYCPNGHTYDNDQDTTCNDCGLVRDLEDAEGDTTPMYRLYNPYTLEHLLTADTAERDLLVSAGWSLDGVAWDSPNEGDLVYRLYNPYDDWHTYTMNQEEIDILVPLGWKVDGVVCRSATKAEGKPVYRLFNPYEQKNYHLLTASEKEREFLMGLGWTLDGVAWYCLAD